jgi:hypothetical protein
MGLFRYIRARIESWILCQKGERKKHVPERATRYPTCQCVLSHKNADDRDIGRARVFRPSDAIKACIVDKCLEDEAAALVCWSRYKDDEDDSNYTKDMPPKGECAQGFEDAHAKCVDYTYATACRGSWE